MKTKTISEIMELYKSVGAASREKAAVYIEGLAEGYKTGYAEGVASKKKQKQKK